MELTVFFPAHNEAQNLPALLDEAFAFLPSLGLDFEVLVVDDGSTDATAQLVEERRRAGESRLRLARHERNRGYGEALKTGLSAARGDLVFFTDGDGQFDIRELARLLPLAGGRTAVAGFRRRRRDALHRRLNGRLWGLLMNLLFGFNVRDVDCAFKLLPRAALAGAPLLSGGALISAELLARLRARGWRIRQVPVGHRPRRAGAASGASPRVILRAFAELARHYGRIRRDA